MQTLWSLAFNLKTFRTDFSSGILIIYLKHLVICIFNENKEEYNVKTSENDVKYSSFNMGEVDKISRVVLQRGK